MTSRRIAVPASLKSRDDVVSTTSRLVDASDEGADIDLDLSDLRGVSPSWGAVLSNVLAGRVSGASHVTVRLPPVADSTNVQLARAGMYFALARHPGLDWEHMEQDASWILRPWQRDWTMTESTSPLFDLAGDELQTQLPDLFAGRILAFLNPNLAPRQVAPDFQNAVTYPWLRQVLRHHGDHDHVEEDRLHTNINFFTWELLDNITEHARLRPRRNCSLATFVTRGRRNLLHMCVMDTGVGVPASLRGRHPGAEEVTLVDDALRGRLPLRGPGRGNGLHRILRRLAEQEAGQFFLASGPTIDGGAVVATWDAGKDKPLQVDAVTGLRMQGTVVLLTVPFGGRAHAASPPRG